MSYPLAPGFRIPWDRDGSLGVYSQPNEAFGSVHAMTGGQMSDLNDEDNGLVLLLGGASGSFAGVIFPELRDLEGYYIRFQGNVPTAPDITTSSDTTDGIDGSWVSRGAYIPSQNTQAADYRISAQPLIVTGIKAVRFYVAISGEIYINNLHLYGQPNGSGDRLEFWDPVSDVKLVPEALNPGTSAGDVVRNSGYDRTFRIKNVSGTLTATGITVSRETLTDNSPSVLTGLLFSIDGGSFDTTVPIASLAPGAISDVITMRYTVPANAALSPNNPRLNVDFDSFA